MNKYVGIIATLLLGFTTLTPVNADTTLKTIIVNTSSAPIHIDTCTAMTEDTAVGNENYYFKPRASYSNVSQKTIKALEIQFTILDDFDTQLARKGGIDGDGLGVGQSSHGVWSYISFPETIAIIKCSVQRVKFMDGSSWPVTY